MYRYLIERLQSKRIQDCVRVLLGQQSPHGPQGSGLARPRCVGPQPKAESLVLVIPFSGLLAKLLLSYQLIHGLAGLKQGVLRVHFMPPCWEKGQSDGHPSGRMAKVMLARLL